MRPFINLEYIYYKIYSFFHDLSFSSFALFLQKLYPYALAWGIAISVLCVILILYLYFKLNEVHALAHEKISVIAQAKGAQEKNTKWHRVEEHINSANPSDWRLAILEADIMLGEMLDKMSFHGETIGEKLKTIERSDFTNIDAAWEAHKIRNQIAHEGADFEISEREAHRVIALYERVFKEFHII